jgi:cytochrome c oxidase subunit II
VRRRTPALVVLAALTLVLVPTALAGGNAGFAPPDSATPSGSTINELYWILIGITAAIFLLVEGALLWFIFRFRRRPSAGPDTEGPQIHGNTRLELVWTAIPVVIVIAILVVTIVLAPRVEADPGAGDDPLLVRVEAHQFYWQYVYPNGVVSINRVRLPVDRPIQLELVGADVVHSWWVPELTGKRDAIPGRINRLNFTAQRTGLYEGVCAEFCGVQHAVMRTEVEVVPEAQFDQWLASEGEAQAAGTSGLGQATWEGVCAKCHGLDGGGDIGPQIAGNSTLVDRQGLATLLAEGIDDPQVEGYMPPVARGWPERQVDALIGYIESNPDLAPAGAAQQGG